MDFPKIWEQTEPYIGEWAKVIISPASVLLFAAVFLIGLGVFLSPDSPQPDGPYRSDSDDDSEEGDESGEESDGDDGSDGSDGDDGEGEAASGSRGRRRIA